MAVESATALTKKDVVGINQLDAGEIQLILDHVRTFCDDSRWPRG